MTPPSPEKCSSRAYALAVGAFFAAWLIYSWPWLSGAVTIPWDAKAHFFPQLQFLAQSLARGEAPFWTPYVFAGSPQIADPQSLIFAPPYLLLALFDGAPGLRAADAVVLVMLFLGGLGLMAWFRDQNWHPAGALLAALLFAFGGSAAWRLQHVGQIMSLSYLPIALWLLDRSLRRSSGCSGLSAGMVSGFMVLGRDQVAYLGVWLLAGFVIWQVAGHRSRGRSVSNSVKPLLCGIVGGLLVATIPVLMTVILADESNRPVIDLVGAGRGSLHPGALLQSFIPHLYGAAGPMELFWGPPSLAWNWTGTYLAQNMGNLYFGAFPVLLLLGYGVLGKVLGAREIRFWVAASIVAFLYALGWYTPFLGLFFHLPGVDLFRRPADATFLIGLMTAILSGYVLHRVVTGSTAPLPRSRLAVMGAAVVIVFGVALGLMVGFDRVAFSAAAYLAALAIFLAAGALLLRLPKFLRQSPAVAIAVVLAFCAADLILNNRPNGSNALPSADYDILTPGSRNETIALVRRRLDETAGPDRRDRIELAGLGFDWPNISLVHRFDNVLGYNPIRLKLYSQATGAQDHVALPGQRQFSPLFPSYRSTLADMLGLRLIVTGVPVEEIDKRLKPGDLTQIARTSDGFVYENAHAWKRVLFMPCSKAADFDALLATGRWPDGVDLTRTVLLRPDEVREHPSGDCSARGSVRIVSYGNDRIELEVDAQAPGYVLLNDVWHPWWRTTVDEAPAALLRANVLFRAVAVTAGRHRVVFAFHPFSGLAAELRAKAANLSGQ